ncbi:MAG: serine hydrolase domain-containing protein, partial [Sphaerobacter sp.]|nr:serine hydrolase domain-containing protein [Sphaerobacter sp.]
PVQPGEPAHEVARRYPLPRCVNAAGGIIADMGDLLKFAAFHLGDGTVGGTRVLSPASLAAMRAPQARAGSFADAYGLAWALHHYDGAQVAGHGGTTGGFQAQLRIVPERRFAVGVLTNSAQGAAAYSEIIDWVLARECHLHPVQPEPVRLSADELAWFAGRYQRPDVTITIAVDGERLRADVVTRSQLSGKETTLPPLSLVPVGEQRFLIADTHVRGETVEFLAGPDGAPRFIRFHGRLADWQGR